MAHVFVVINEPLLMAVGSISLLQSVALLGESLCSRAAKKVLVRQRTFIEMLSGRGRCGHGQREDDRADRLPYPRSAKTSDRENCPKSQKGQARTH